MGTAGGDNSSGYRTVSITLRAATMQFGYFAGSVAGGVALTVGGYSALGAIMGAVFLAAAASLAHDPRRGRATSALPPALSIGNRSRVS